MQIKSLHTKYTSSYNYSSADLELGNDKQEMYVILWNTDGFVHRQRSRRRPKNKIAQQDTRRLQGVNIGGKKTDPRQTEVK